MATSAGTLEMTLELKSKVEGQLSRLRTDLSNLSGDAKDFGVTLESAIKKGADSTDKILEKLVKLHSSMGRAELFGIDTSKAEKSVSTLQGRLESVINSLSSIKIDPLNTTTIEGLRSIRAELDSMGRIKEFKPVISDLDKAIRDAEKYQAAMDKMAAAEQRAIERQMDLDKKIGQRNWTKYEDKIAKQQGDAITAEIKQSIEAENAKAKAAEDAAKRYERAWMEARKIATQNLVNYGMSKDERSAWNRYYSDMEKNAQKAAKAMKDAESVRLQAMERTALSIQNSSPYGYNTMEPGVRAQMQEFYKQQEIDAKRAAEAEKQATKDAAKAVKEKAEADRQAKREAAENAKVQQDLARAYKQVSDEANKSSKFISDMFGQFRYLIGGMGIQQLLSSIITVGGEIEQQHIAMRNIVGSLSEADALFAEIKGLALESPFTFGELNRDVKQLMAYGVEIGNIYETTKRLGDISAGLGVSFERIALAYGQTKAREWLDAKELRQFAYAGIPLQAELAKLYTQRTGSNITTKDVQKMIKNRQVGFEDVQTVLFNMTKEGGKFYEQQAVLAETLLGKWNKLKDAWEIIMSDFASGESTIGRTMKTALEGITSLVLGFNKLLPFVATFFAAFTARKIGAILSSLGTVMSGAFMARNSLSKNFLNFKGGLANDAARKLMLGKELSVTEARILATKTQITRQDIVHLQNANAINAAEARRLNLTRQMSIRYALLQRQMASKNIGGAFMSGLGLAGAATRNALGFFGGPIGAGLTATALGGMYLYEDHQKTKESYDRNAQAIKDSHDNLQKFLEDNPLVMSFTTKEDEAATYKLLNDKYKEIMGYDFAPNGNSEESAYKQLYDKMKDLEYAAKIAEGLSKVMPNINKDVDIVDSTNDYINALKDYKANMNADTRSEMSSQWNDLFADSQKVFESLKGHVSGYGKHAEDVFKMLVREFAKSNDELSADAKEAFIDLMDLRYANSQGAEGITKYLSEKILADAPNIRKAVHDMFLEGKTQEEIGKEMGDRVQDATITTIKNRFPELYGQLQSYVGSNPLLVNVILSVKNGTTENALRDALIGNLNMGPSELKEKAKAQIESISKGTIEEANKAAIDNRDNLKKEIARAKKLKGYDPLAIAKLEEDLKVANAIVDAGGFSDYHKNSGSKKDVLAEQWKKRLSLMKEYASEYDKWMKLVGKNEALAKMKEQKWDEVFGETFNYEDPRQAIRDYLKSNVEGNAKTDAQKEALKNFMKEIFGFDADDAQKEIEALTKDITKQIDDAKKKWELYTKAKESTSDRGVASQLAFGGDVQFENSMEYFANMIKEFIKKNNINKSFDEVVAMTDFTSLGDKIAKPLEAMVKAYSDAMNKLADDTVSNYLRIVKESANYEQQVADIRKKLGQDLQDLRKQGGTSEQESWLRKKADENISKVLFEQFKETSGWTDLFDDLARVSTDSLSVMEDKIKAFTAAQKLSIQDTKALTDAMRKLREENIKRNPFTAIAEGFKENPFKTFMKNNKKNEYGLWDLWDLDVAKRLGVKAGVYTDEEMEKFSRDYNSKAMDNFIKGLNAVVAALKAFEDILKPVSDLFSALGNENLADVIGIGSNAFSSASSVASAFKTLGDIKGFEFLGKASPYGAAAAALLSVITSVAKLHDKVIQEEIEASKHRQSEMDNIYSKVTGAMQSDIYGVYGQGNARQLMRLQENVGGMKQSYWTAGGTLYGNSYASNELVAALKKAMSTGSNYDTGFAALLAKRDEAQYQMEKESKKKKSDADAISDYKEQIEELNEEISKYAVEMAKALYGIDIVAYSKKLSSALADAWRNGTDMAKAYGDAVKDIMNDLADSIFDQMIMQQLLKNSGIEEYIAKAMADNSGRLTTENMTWLANAIKGLGEDAVEQAQTYYDLLQSMGVATKDYKTTNGTLSTNIQNITEPTAQLLESYINSIRAYVAQDNLMFTTFFTNTLPEMNAIQQSQLDHLAMISNDVHLIADKIVGMHEHFASVESNISAVVNGAKKMHIE